MFYEHVAMMLVFFGFPVFIAFLVWPTKAKEESARERAIFEREEEEREIENANNLA